MEPTKVAVIIPAWNEEKNIGLVLSDLLDHNYQPIVINDGSTDQTSNVVRSFPNVILLEHAINLGMGAALETGTRYALNSGAEIIVHFDADRQMQVEDIKKMILPIINKEVDITIGNRFPSSQIPTLKKYLIFPVARVLNNFMTGLQLTDIHNGFRALSAVAAKKINIQQRGWAHATEIMQKVKKYNLKYREIPVTIKYHEFGQGVGSGFKILRDLFIKKII